MTTKTNKICHSLKNHHIKRQIKYHQIKYTMRTIWQKCLFVKKFFFRFPSKNAIFRQIQKSMVNINKNIYTNRCNKLHRIWFKKKLIKTIKNEAFIMFLLNFNLIWSSDFLISLQHDASLYWSLKPDAVH